MQQKKRGKLTKRKLDRKKIKMVSNPVSSDKRKTRKRQFRGGGGENADSDEYDFPSGENTFRNAKANVKAKVKVKVKVAKDDSSGDNSSGDNNNPFNVTGQKSAIHDPDAFDNKTFNQRVIGGMVVVSFGAVAAVVAQ